MVLSELRLTVQRLWTGETPDECAREVRVGIELPGEEQARLVRFPVPAGYESRSVTFTLEVPLG